LTGADHPYRAQRLIKSREEDEMDQPVASFETISFDDERDLVPGTSHEADIRQPDSHQLPALIPVADAMAGARLVSYPDYTASNPYQHGLYSAFRLSGEVEYGTIQRALELIATAAPDRPIIFHLHWPDPLFADVKDAFDYQSRASNFLRAVRAFKAMGGIFLWTIHNRLPHETAFGEVGADFHRRLADAANIIHLHDDAAIAQVCQSYPIDQRKCIIVPHGSYEGCYGPAFNKYQSRQLLGLKDVDSLILLFGQIRPYKGLDELLHAFQALGDDADRDQVHLLIAGKPMAGFTAAHARLIEENNPRIHILDGFIPDTKVPLLFGAADLIALPYNDVLTSGTMMLAAHYGKPVVAPRSPALALVDEAGLGITYDAEVPGALTTALGRGLDLDHDARTAISMAGRKLSTSLSWTNVSARFHEALAQRITPKAEVVRVGRSSRTVHYIRRQDAEQAQLGVGIVNTGCAARVAAQLAEISMMTDRSIRTYVFDAASNGIPHYGLQTLTDVLAYINTPASLACATNLLLAMMRDDGCEQALLLNPDMLLDKEAVTALLAQGRADAIVAPLALADNGRIDQGGYRSYHGPGGCLELEPLLAGDKPLLDRQPYLAQALDHYGLLLPTMLLDKTGFLPEDHVTSQAVVEWSMAAKRKGIALIVQPSSQARPIAEPTQNAFPGIEPLYYLIRGRFHLARKWAPRNMRPTPAAIIDHLNGGLITPLRKMVAKSSTDLLPLFDRCVHAAIEDGADNVRGMIDVGQRIDEVILFDEGESQGRIDRKTDAQLCGWIAERAAPTAEWRPGVAWLFRNGQPVSRIEPSLPRADVVEAGYGEGTGFTFPIPRRIDEDRAHFELRNSINGRRLPVSGSLKGDVWSTDKGVGAPRKPILKAMVETVSDGMLRGWAVDLAHPDIKIRLDIFIDNDLVATAIAADIDREDLRRARIGDGRHGFSLQLRNRHLLQESLQVELRLAGEDKSLTKKTVAVKNDNRGFSPYFSMRSFLQWAYCEDRMGAGHSELATSLLRQLEMEKRLLKKRTAPSDAGELVSIIMPAYNRASVINMAIQSVLDQSHENFELIIVDDGSTDETAAIVQAIDDPRIILIRLPENRGVSVARNRALDEAKGDIIAYLDTDNLWDTDYLAIMTGALSERRGYQSAYAGQVIYQTVAGSGDIPDRQEQKAIRLCPFNRSRLEERNFIDLNVFVHRRHLHGLHGGFDEQLRRLVDWDLILRYTRDTPPLMVPALLGGYQAGRVDNQITATEDFNSNRSRLHVPTPATMVQTARHEPRGLNIVVQAQSEEDLKNWMKANGNLLGSAIGTVAGVWETADGACCLAFDAQSHQPGERTALATTTALFDRFLHDDPPRSLLITRSDHAIRGDWARTLDRLRSTEAFAAATGRLYQHSTHGRFGSVYHDMTPARIKGHVLDWTISPSISGQKSRQLPRDYLFIPADHVDRMQVAAALTRDFEDMLDRYFDSFALSDTACLYASDLIACHRDDVLPWS
jgi:glycosyltransferase involved in cell wall biosynthesis/GT2 family glycosyltransferase